MIVKTWFEEGFEQGFEKGREKGFQIVRQILLVQLEQQFGTLSETARQRLEAWPAEKHLELGRAILHAYSLAELGLEDWPSPSLVVDADPSRHRSS